MRQVVSTVEFLQEVVAKYLYEFIEQIFARKLYIVSHRFAT